MSSLRTLSGPVRCSCPGGEGHCTPGTLAHCCPLGPSPSSWGGKIGPAGQAGARNSQAIILHPQCGLSLCSFYRVRQNAQLAIGRHKEPLSDIAHRGSLCDPDRREVSSLLVAQSPLESETQAMDCTERSPLVPVQCPLDQREVHRAAEFGPSPRRKLSLCRSPPCPAGVMRLLHQLCMVESTVGVG